ncbi:4-hydroxy-tetrahydrodipicolinate synthase, partial [Bienertia sinuspersici]
MSTTTSLRLLLSLSPSTPPLKPSSASPSWSICSTSPLSSSSPSSSSSSSSSPCRKKWFPPKRSSLNFKIGANMKNHEDMDEGRTGMESHMFGSEEESGTKIPSQAQSIVEGSSSVMVSEFKPVRDVDYIQELLAIQQQGPRSIGFFGTRNMGFMHQELIEILSYAMVITKNHIYTSGASGTNAAVIRGALRAEAPELLTVILPQSLKKQPPESQELLAK